jgi:hypothetical protein
VSDLSSLESPGHACFSNLSELIFGEVRPKLFRVQVVKEAIAEFQPEKHEFQP